MEAPKSFHPSIRSTDHPSPSGGIRCPAVGSSPTIVLLSLLLLPIGVAGRCHQIDGCWELIVHSADTFSDEHLRKLVPFSRVLRRYHTDFD
jgi:hypothetical protein